METQKLRDVFAEWKTYGIFQALAANHAPWENIVSPSFLDYVYFCNHSGEKTISGFLSAIKTGETISHGETTLLANIILSEYSIYWGKLWQTMFFDYNPIENYNMTETLVGSDETEHGHTIQRADNLTHGVTRNQTRTDALTETRTDNLTEGNSESETRTDNLTDTTNSTLDRDTTQEKEYAPGITETEKKSVWGFNTGSTPRDADTVVKTKTGTDTESITGTQDDSISETVTHTGTSGSTKTGTKTNSGTQATENTGTQTFVETESNTHGGTSTETNSGTDIISREHELTRSGNIGVTTSQQMIDAERNVYMWRFFETVVFPDIDRLLTIDTY